MDKNQPLIIHWFRYDLRLHDNPSLFYASKKATILPLYILDTKNGQNFSMGAASKIWLYQSLTMLNRHLEGKLNVTSGDPIKIIENLVITHQIKAVFWNKCYEPWQIDRDTKIQNMLESRGIEVQSFNASLLWEHSNIRKADGSPYKVFTPFYRKGCLNATPPREPLGRPKALNLFKASKLDGIDRLNLLPKITWYHSILNTWSIGEESAQQKSQLFFSKKINHYKKGRDFFSQSHVSTLSPHIHFGEISVHQLWNMALHVGDDENIDHFLSELGWREFSYYQLNLHPSLPIQNLQKKFDRFPWDDHKQTLELWQKGQTGIPIVDAGMRELWKTGYMHNRVRMVTASFLVKNLLLHWRHGERWFWDCLVDADLANNSANWQWVAGCGADAAPYFRIFNPITQGLKFDINGDYVRCFVPELKKLPNAYIFCPWNASTEILKNANIKLGINYPSPIVDIKKSRERALSAYHSLKNK